MEQITHCVAKLCLGVGLAVLLTACGSSEENAEVATVEATATSAEVLTQKQVEELADLSMQDIKVASDFVFATQRMVTLDLRFSKIQDSAQIAIYSELDQSSTSQGTLLEKGQIQNSTQYRGMLSVISSVDTLIVVPNENFSAAVAIDIDQNDRLHYIFEEL
ncbi:MAG: hypothetical protein HRU23_11680 [Gammaproteobacteria bacterium]|nr:hypothetical protein [Gammaproteobacteria bacterium]